MMFMTKEQNSVQGCFMQQQLILCFERIEQKKYQIFPVFYHLQQIADKNIRSHITGFPFFETSGWTFERVRSVFST